MDKYKRFFLFQIFLEGIDFCLSKFTRSLHYTLLRNYDINIPEEEKEEKRKYGRNRYRNLFEEEKENREYRRNYYEKLKSNLINLIKPD